MLGIVIGVVAGLLVAMLVAVYVTKVPVPFLNKNAGTAGEREQAEAKKNKDWDPNGPLAAKSVVQPPPPAQTPAIGAANPVALPPLGPARDATGAIVGRADPRASTDPLGDLARSRAGPATVVGGGDGEPFAYFVQAGAFRGSGEAEAQRAKLAIMGWEAQVTEREQAGRTVYRVRLGPFGRKDEADRAKERLDQAGLQTALVRVQR